uniref:Bm10831 n=1 Tax=Brugia malayi TaxID=6279 RepID=A0A1I9G4I1_BRUMA|nr:Bm10831 [Brugia malayi]
MAGVRVGDSDALFSKIDDLKVFETFLEGVTCSTLIPKIRSRVFVDGPLRFGVCNQVHSCNQMQKDKKFF